MFIKVGVSVFRTAVQTLLLLGSDFDDEDHKTSNENNGDTQTLHGSRVQNSSNMNAVFENEIPSAQEYKAFLTLALAVAMVMLITKPSTLNNLGLQSNGIESCGNLNVKCLLMHYH